MTAAAAPPNPPKERAMPQLTIRHGVVVVVLVLAVLLALGVLPFTALIVGGLIGLIALGLLV
jgi:hypothetical protein